MVGCSAQHSPTAFAALPHCCSPGEAGTMTQKLLYSSRIKMSSQDYGNPYSYYGRSERTAPSGVRCRSALSVQAAVASFFSPADWQLDSQPCCALWLAYVATLACLVAPLSRHSLSLWPLQMPHRRPSWQRSSRLLCWTRCAAGRGPGAVQECAQSLFKQNMMPCRPASCRHLCWMQAATASPHGTLTCPARRPAGRPG